MSIKFDPGRIFDGVKYAHSANKKNRILGNLNKAINGAESDSLSTDNTYDPQDRYQSTNSQYNNFNPIKTVETYKNTPNLNDQVDTALNRISYMENILMNTMDHKRSNNDELNKINEIVSTLKEVINELKDIAEE